MVVLPRYHRIGVYYRSKRPTRYIHFIISNTFYLTQPVQMPPRRRQKIKLGHPKLKKARKNGSQSSKLLADWEEAEEEWCEDECNSISQALTQAASTSAMEGVFESIEDNVHGVAPEFDTEPVIEESDGETTDGSDSHSSLSSRLDDVVQIPGNYNRRRRMQEERKWAEVIEPMFKAFFICQRLTKEWSHSDTWNRDLKTVCRCSMAKKHVRTLDVDDILSTSFHLLFFHLLFFYQIFL